MNLPVNPPSPPNSPQIKFDTLVQTLGAPSRCAILGALSDGQPRMVNEIAAMTGLKPGAVSKQMSLLLRVGLVELNQRLYRVPAAYIADTGKRHLDFGHCLLRLPDAKGLPTR
jgi:DNA-binding transcriptional ArsR family regulator